MSWRSIFKVILICCIAEALAIMTFTPVHCEDYFSYCCRNFPRKIGFHYGGETLLTGLIYGCTRDDKGAMAMGLGAGASVEAYQMIFEKEKFWPNAVGDFCLWDAPGCACGEIADDLLGIDLRPKKNGVVLTFKF